MGDEEEDPILKAIYDAMDAKDFKKAIELATEEAKKADGDEFLFRKLIGKSLLDDYFIKLETQKDSQLSNQARDELLKSWTLQQEENEETLLFLADSELVLGMYEESKSHYLQLSTLLQGGSKEQATLSACYAGLAECEMKMNKFEDAIKQYQNVIDRKDKNENQDFGQIYKNRAICFYNLGDYKGAETDIKKALVINPKQARLYALQVSIFESQNKYKEAETFLNSGIHKDCKDDPIILEAKGKIFLHQQKYAQAEEIFKQMKGVEAQLGLAQSCLKQKKYPQAIELYEAILKDHPKNLSALNNLGICYLENQKLDQAKDMFQKVIEQNHDDMIAMSNLSDIEFKLAQQNKDGKQEAHIQETIRLSEIVTKSPDPFERAVAFNRLGACYQMQKKYKEAEDAFIKSIAAEPKFVLAWANKAQVELMLDKPGESLASLKKSEELLKDDFSKKNLSDANINFIQAGLKKIVSLQENFGKAADEIKAKMDAMLKRPNVLAGHKNITKEYEELEKQRIEMLKKQYEKIQTNQGKSEGEDKDYELLQQQIEQLKKKIENQSKEIDEIEKKQKEQAKRTAALEQRVDKMRDTLRASGVYEQGKIKAWMNENRHKEEGKYAKAFYWTLLNYIDSYRAASTGILQTNVEHAEIDSKVSTGVTLAKKALEVGSSLCESLPLVGSIFKVIDGAIDYCYSEYKQKKFEDKVNSINKIIMENHTANTQEDLSQVITKAAIEIAKKKSTAKVFIQIQFELDNPKPPGTIDKITGFFTDKINRIREYALGKQIELYDSVGGGEALKDVILCLAHLQKNFADVIKKSETILLDVQIEQIVTEKIQALLKDMKEVPQKDLKTELEEMEADWEVPHQTAEQIKFQQEEQARKDQLKKEAELKKQQEIEEQQKKLQQQQAAEQQASQQPAPQQPPPQQPAPQQPPPQQPPTQQPPPQQPPPQQPPTQQPPTQQPPPQQPPQQHQTQQPPQQNNHVHEEEENVQVQKQNRPIEVGNQDKQEKKQPEQSRESSCCIIY